MKFKACPFCGNQPRDLADKSGLYTARVICDVCSFSTTLEVWETRTINHETFKQLRDQVLDALEGTGNEEFFAPPRKIAKELLAEAEKAIYAKELEHDKELETLRRLINKHGIPEGLTDG